MRLTLRTLLAHLDRTLDPDDDAAIAAKLRESEFASKLADRVRAGLQSDVLEAPSTLATGTADDPNRIGEYLDSVLSSEQVAEVERICLESDAHLAEVAACHQILTLVLAKPAEIPVSLKSKLYELGQDTHSDHSSPNGSVAGPVGPLVAEIALSETLVSPAGMASVVKPAGVGAPPISPVGLDDSGVSNAPTRLKDTAGMYPGPSSADAVLAGSKKLSASDLADFTGRPSRVMPWLVSLALVAAFFFVASQAFAPLLQRRAGDDDTLLTLGGPDPGPAEDPQPSSADSPAVIAPPEGGTPVVPETAPATVPAPESPPAAATETTTIETAPAPRPSVTTQPGGTTATPPPAPPEVIVPETPLPPSDLPGPVMVPPAVTAGQTPSDPATVTDSAAVVEQPVDGDPVEDEQPIVITSDGALLLVRDPDADTWVLGTLDDVVQPDSELICPPLYGNRLSIHEEAELTMIGPARVTLRHAPGKTAELILEYGRYLLVGVGQQRQVNIRFDDTDSVLTLPSPESVAAIEVVSARPPGLDPESEAATRRVIQVLAVQGAPRWRSGNRPEVTLETGQLLTVSRGNQVSLSDASSIPRWLDQPVEAVASIESSSREGLLGLVRGNEAIELSLREAMDFRRAEVGALAARTLLLLDRHDVYFGAEGVFSQVRQRTYWPDHFNAVLAAINRGPETAAAVRQAIERMDAAQADEIYRLLWLYSDNQLAAGSDESLVRALDSSNMAIRVLAAENLRHITGNTLLYKPEVETSSRRSGDIKKWETRLRRGEIRWTTPARPEAVDPAATTAFEEP